jgi:Na+-driven multidrug efflux pump
MKKLQLVELGIIATVLIIGYEMVTSLLNLVTSMLFFGFGVGIGRNVMIAILPTVLFFAFYTIIFFLLARNTKPLARFICRDNEGFLDLKLTKPSILHVIIVTVCLISFLQTIPDIIQYLVNKFINVDQISNELDRMESRTRKVGFWNSLISFIISVLFLIASRNIASFFGKEDELLEIAGEKIESNI